ncbi:MAG: iron-containing alcohol dehydrogenase, partial [Sedimentisphaerales bacterium]|nr:iron-containing alcohol dehydrogenase [Sedimentisphaerales bacterium]
MAASDSKWTMKLPVPVEFGAGCVAKMANYVTGYKKALIVSQLVGTPAETVIDQIGEVLKSAGVESKVFHKFSPESNYTEIEEGGALAKEFGADSIVGFGGGSSMDAAKLIALAASHPEPLLSYRVGGTHEITKATLPILLVTSTSGTGSHIGRVAVVSEQEKGLKRFMASDYLYPKAAFCDPEILRLMPAGLTATSGFDAFAQALEGYLSMAENPMGKFCAQEAMRIIAEVLPKVYKDGNNLELRA